MLRLKLANDATFDRMDKTLHALRKQLWPSSDMTDDPVTPSGLTAALLGLRRPVTDLQLPDELITYLDDRLNESQQEAVKFALHRADSVALIHGPPGCALSSSPRLFANIIAQVLARHKRLWRSFDN